MKKLIIVRHGQTNANLEGRTQGQIDTPLNDLGLLQAKKTGEFIKNNFSISEAWSSDLIRTQTTTKNIFKNYKTTNLIREMSFGNWENKLFEAIAKKSPELVKEYQNATDQFKAPDGESFGDLFDRAEEFTKSLDFNNEKEILIVSHGGFMRVLITYLLNLPKKNLLNFHFENCSITEILVNKKKLLDSKSKESEGKISSNIGLIIKRVNYTDHLNILK
tara:strand:+ start:2026 stop:2682 length:657 start_codon:yes stop_codon:yes gene_type:complete